MPWLSEIAKPHPCVVNSVKLIPGKDGYVIETDDYSCWLWKSDKTGLQLVQALSIFCENKQGKLLQVIPDKKQKRGFRIEPALDDSKQPIGCAWHLSDSGYTIVEAEKVDEENPFL